MLRLALLLIALAASLLPLPAPALAQEPAAQPGVRTVELDGRRVRIQALGLENRRPGQPVVVFEAGATSSLDAWRQVLPEVAAGAPVIAYDRAGLGQSEPDAVQPTPRHVTGRLRRLLRQSGAEPPYVLVGHSWGGMLIHYYAGYHPEEVAGLVFVDPA
ncbi:MAG TPA: alpha/beta fold hydrolase, partial [Allosphingosinicella sp.]|nr:alpha/beta fold hydrolase [Allosphingosinicella sp.]